MIIFLYGPDSYRRQKKLREVIAAYTSKHSLPALEHFDLSEEDGLERLGDFLIGQSMFEALKLAVIHHPFEAANIDEARMIFKSHLEAPQVVFVIENDDAPPDGFGFLETKPAVSQLFGSLNAERLAAFLIKEASSRGKALPLSEARSLAAVYEGDTWGAVNELEKMQLAGRISFEPILQDNFWRLLSIIASGSSAKFKIPALERLFVQNEDEGKIFNILASRLAKRGEGVGEVADYDVAVKSGKMDYATALVDFCLGVNAGRGGI
ncbi:MAG: hypothetical protein HY456_01855 [Parcubacteria group bacterium]|nr:hypothetical protein [Parcubacteria group bacterium]